MTSSRGWDEWPSPSPYAQATACMPTSFEQWTDSSRQRDLFPLPMLDVVDTVHNSLAHSVRSRILRRRKTQLLVNEISRTLNDLARAPGTPGAKATCVYIYMLFI